jgi:hypothetical protein
VAVCVLGQQKLELPVFGYKAVVPDIQEVLAKARNLGVQHHEGDVSGRNARNELV